MIHKLLIVRKAQSRSDLLKVAGVDQFADGEPLNVSPVAWHDEHGLSHYGYVLKELDLESFQKLEKFCHVNEGLTLLDYDTDHRTSLASVGLRINESAKAK